MYRIPEFFNGSGETLKPRVCIEDYIKYYENPNEKVVLTEGKQNSAFYSN